MSGVTADNPYRASGVVAAAAAGGGVSWQSVTTASTLTAEAGNGYPINTTSNACTVTLPGSAEVGDEIIFSDYARKWGTNAVTINQNSLKYQGATSPNPVYDTAGESVHIVYMDATNGWIPTYDGAVALETGQSYNAVWLVLGGGGNGGESNGGGGGGAGGLRSSEDSTGGGGSTESDATLVGGTTYTCTIGAGAAGDQTASDRGGDSSISGTGLTTIEALGGGRGVVGGQIDDGKDGGCGGGGDYDGGSTGGSGTANQGYDGGGPGNGGTAQNPGNGGGGTGAAGGRASGNSTAGNGGNGTANDIVEAGTDVTYGGGGGGGCAISGLGSGGSGGGGAGQQSNTGSGGAATDALGGGGGGGGDGSSDGGNGLVVLRVPTASYSGSTSGSPTISTDGDFTVMKFTGTGTYVA